MKQTATTISGIPALLWGEESDRVYLYVHGKFSCKEDAATFAALAEKRGMQTLSFDLPEHGARKGASERCDIWTGMRDLTAMADAAFAGWREVSLFACSLGAYFSLNTYADRPFAKCLFQSPVVDMEYLIRQMFVWFDVTEETLRAEKEIATPIDPLRWDYFQYVLAHPIEKWTLPTAILYGGKDNLQSFEVISHFAKAHSCRLTVSEHSEHPFMQAGDAETVSSWLEENL